MSHYDSNYFEWQKKIGMFGGKANLFKFEPFIEGHNNVLDFGCGGGYLLEQIKCESKIGIEINDIARGAAISRGLAVYKNLEEVNNGWADVIISNHALEHTLRPLDELISIRSKLSKNGKIVFVVPHERRNKFKSNDINQHLYTWSEMCLGNLFTLAGFKVLSVETLVHRWPPKAISLQRLVGWKMFNIISGVNGLLNTSITQIRIIGERD